LLFSEAAGHEEGVLVADRDDLVADLRVVGGGPDVFPHALHQVGAASAAGVDRAFRVGADDLHPAVGDLFQVAAGAGDRAAGADPRDEVGDAAFGLLPDLRPGAVVVRLRVVGVAVLVGFPRAGDRRGQAVGDRVVGLGVVGGDGRGADHDFGPVGAQHREFVGADLVRADEDAAVALFRGDDRQAYTGVSGGGLHDRAAWFEEAPPFGVFDHTQGDAVFHRSP